MKIIFAAYLNNPSASGFQRLWAIQQCGIEVVVFNTSNYPSKLGKRAESFAKILQTPRFRQNSASLEKDFINICKINKPDIIWLEWPREIQPSVLEEVKKINPRPYLISMQDDNPWGDRNGDKWMWKDYLKLVPYFDLHLVKRENDIKNLQSLGANKCRLWQHGIYSPLYHPSKNEIKIYPVSFVGTCMDKRGAFIERLLNDGIDIHVFGQLWNKRSGNLVNRFPNNFHPPVWGEDYANVIRSSELALCTVSDSNHDEWTMRSYEIPGCATAALVKKTPIHEKMFTNGETAFFYNNEAECSKIITEVLSQPGLSLQIGKNAERTFKKNNWTIESRMKDLFIELTNDKSINNYNPIIIN
ncbi:glycosyl transferase family 1 [Mucilaginibacter frigoritolerans]|uniref:Glycosyl transferase family 1 n=1 Tax=Mucilaginibacter frigoritolerans TaxID=652788 RepID=A0A562U4N5_9SPHI|nr:glycosyltransferase [Mucilaginibacter frigoritolerans]TWJ00793.1 glycosyl transferase family 1 [Mucilaginibacter frigoritolerans]